ncbi:Sulfate adenylyltransferase [Zancudomyces culisetae]|uniref:sulfate adenylyltransferase n=1 Tax=Zancudomyces culisetae TaxID=1213189 RepID=A0A1R1PXW1_ZANCU|nr:Sulfate adenylyltransferase [Zancudomyces culisetae]|eukprot:OMH85783.1 Sulfate adenylyltransferase [Zancudomyces culisetae]
MTISPHGGILKDLIARDAPIKAQLEESAKTLPSLELTERQLCDLELLSNGGFSPLEGFMTKEDYSSVVNSDRLANGLVWTIPVCLDTNLDHLKKIFNTNENNEILGKKLVLVDPRNGSNLAIIKIKDLYSVDKEEEAIKVFGTKSTHHPAVDYLFNQTGDIYIGGDIQIINPVSHEDFQEIRFTPAQVREKFEKDGFERVVAFQTRNPMHRAHHELTLRAGEKVNAKILVHPVVGMTKPGDVDYITRVKVYKIIMEYYKPNTAFLSLLPLAMRMAGPKEAVWHAIIRKNYGASHIIVGRDHAGPGKDIDGKDFYGPYEAQEFIEQYEDELEIKPVRFSMLAYLPDENRYEEIDKLEKGAKTLNISGTELRNMLKTGEDIPEWFSYPHVVSVLKSEYAKLQKAQA